MSTIEPTCVVIADISGYTGYLAGVELDHAQDILADLMGTVVTSLRPTFRLAKLEGDAAFVFAPVARLDGSIVLDVIERCYVGFRRRRRDVRQATNCECAACTRIPDLDIKFVVHCGPVAQQKMAGRAELVGAPVIVAHRLLKNSLAESNGMTAYALLTQAAVDTFGLRPEELGMRCHVETYEHIGQVVAWAEDLQKRWTEEDARQRVLVGAGESVLTLEFETAAPPQLAWEFMTKPGRRTAWNGDVTEVIQLAKAGRRKVGETNHCMHGREAVVEKILDWRPYDYFTTLSTIPTPAGAVTMLMTTEFTPSTSGTVIVMRLGRPATKREMEVVAAMGPGFQARMNEAGRVLREQLAEECERISTEQTDEPEVPRPAGSIPLPNPS